MPFTSGFGAGADQLNASFSVGTGLTIVTANSAGDDGVTFSFALTGDVTALMNNSNVVSVADFNGTSSANPFTSPQSYITYFGDAGDDNITFSTTPNFNTIFGGDGDDTINIPPYSTAYGGSGNDSVTVGFSNTIYGGDGNDTISSTTWVMTAFGGAGTDSMIGASQIDTINGGSGDDTIYGSGAADSLTGGTGADYFAYRALSESTTTSRDTITDFNQGEGDKLWIQNGFDNIITGGTGTASIDSALGGFEVGNLVSYQSSGNTFVYDPFSISNPTTFSIQLTGLITLTLADFVFAGGAPSTTGTPVVDTITSASGVILGFASNDTISAISSPTINGGDGNDSMSSSSSGYFIGGSGDDSISGSAGPDRFFAGSGGDIITGSGGTDSIFAGASDGAIDRIIYSATTNGALAGAVTGHDTISQFEVGTDKIAFTSTLNTNFDDILGTTGTFVWVSNPSPSIANFTTTYEGLFRSGFADADLIQASFITLLANLNALNFTAGSGADAIIVAQGATQTAFYLYTESTGVDNIVATELTLLGISNGLLTTSDFIFA